MENFRERRKPVDGIIIHSMAEYIDGEYAYDFLERIGLSAHFFVDSMGNIIHGVGPGYVAYHAGKSAWKDDVDLNENFIGIELLIQGDHTYASFKQAIKDPESFTQDHYEKCAKICRDLIETYPRITKDRILRHSTVSGPEVREDPKIDPGKGFDMDKLKQLI